MPYGHARRKRVNVSYMIFCEDIVQQFLIETLANMRQIQVIEEKFNDNCLNLKAITWT